MPNFTTKVAYLLTSLLCSTILAWGQSVYFFQDSDNSSFYDTGLAFKTSPSEITQTGPSGDKLPISTTAIEGNHSLRIQWTSRSGGDWSALIIAPGFPFLNISQLDTLAFWVRSEEGIAVENLPLIYMEGAPGATKSNRYSLAPFTDDLPAGTWQRIKIPLSLFFNDPNQTNINFSQTKAIIFGQNTADGQQHTLLVDEVLAYRSSGGGERPNPPATIAAKGYDSHIEVRWKRIEDNSIANYRIYRSTAGGEFELIRSMQATDSLFIDFVGRTDGEWSYKITSVTSGGLESDSSETATAQTAEMSDEELLTMVQEYTFRYFWDFGHPVSGLARERNTSGETVTIGGSGFGVMAILVGIERGFITKEQGLKRLLKIVHFLQAADRFHGAWPHWMNGTTGTVQPFSQFDNGGDLVETAFMIQGLLTVRQYFDGDSADEIELRDIITQLWEEVEWNWYRKITNNVLYWHWSPNYTWQLNLALRGFNETHIVYILAIASPTNGIPASLYHSGWAGSNYVNGNSYYGYPLAVGFPFGGPLFFAHYSYLGFDPRYKKDRYTNYFIRNRNQTLINRAYAIDNPENHEGYSAESWGLTASDNPFGYSAHEPIPDRDNGTLTPTAALSSMPYTPDESLAALKHFYRDLGDQLWGPMGFYDAFNLDEDWFATSYLAIDQGPIIGMIENYRTELLWQNFMKNPEIEPALDAIGFVEDSMTVAVQELPENLIAVTIAPNPVTDFGQVNFELAQSETATIRLVDAMGKEQGVIAPRQKLQAGRHQFSFSTANFPTGLYFLQIQFDTNTYTQKVLIIRRK